MEKGQEMEQKLKYRIKVQNLIIELKYRGNVEINYKNIARLNSTESIQLRDLFKKWNAGKIEQKRAHSTKSSSY